PQCLLSLITFGYLERSPDKLQRESQGVETVPTIPKPAPTLPLKESVAERSGSAGVVGVPDLRLQSRTRDRQHLASQMLPCRLKIW
ncbi:hypothetical protein JYU34_018634, partial [Plutella xylostella]